MARSKDVKTPLARVAFAQNLFTPQEKVSKKGTFKQYGASLLFPKSDDLSPLKEIAVEAAVAEWGEKAIQMIKDGLIKNPILDGDGPQGASKKTGERHDGFAGHNFIRVISGEKFPPRILNQAVHEAGPDELKSGYYGYAVVNAFTWENAENGKGITFGISLFQIAKGTDADVLGGSGGPSPEAFFTKIEDEGEAPAETKTGSGAAGLFA